jgi:6-pyruvoyltetrahydropterin/6-carboxytetrahydropterin synthase
MKIGIVEYIDCAHHLPAHPKCGVLHGHTYKVEISIEGETRQGMILDFADLKRLVRSVLAEYDHRNWNDFIAYPTVENICQLIHERLKAKVEFPFTLRVWEGEGKWAEI